MTMDILNSILKIGAGIGLFLFAMHLLEESLKNLSGRNFKLFLQKITKNNISAVAGGIIITVVLQSSSMISLMVLAFVGAGVFSVKNAIAIILGANLGTTLASWILATLGFGINIAVFAYQIICFSGFLLIFFGKRKNIKYVSYFLFGFGLLFIGLSFMKMAMESQVENFDFSIYNQLPLFAFLVLGFAITILIQSSSATMALTLSALHAGAISFPPAAAIVLGAETGTIMKIILSASKGNATKKRVALGNLVFNISITSLSFILIEELLSLITDVLNIKDPLIGLVTFSSFINLLSILIFLPFLNRFAKFLERFFKETDSCAAAFIGHASTIEPETAIDLLRMETKYFIHNSMLFNLELFEINLKSFRENDEFKNINTKKKYFSKNMEEKYEFLKQLQGELQAFYLELRTKLQSERSSELNQLISAVRSSMHAVKSIKDIGTNISNLKSSSKDIKYNFFVYHRKKTKNLYRELNALFTKNDAADFEKFHEIFQTIQNNYTEALNNFYTEAQTSKVENIDITTVINFNRELFTSNKAMLIAIKDSLLDEKQAADFNEIPVYKT